MNIFDGRFHAKKLEENVIKPFLQKNHPNKTLLIIQIGDNPSSTAYVGLKKSLCQKLAIQVRVVNINEDLPNKKISEIVKKSFKDASVGGGIIQLPLPRESLRSILGEIPEEKDIDVLSPKSLEKFYSGDFSKSSPIVRAFEYFLSESGIVLDGLKVTFVGSGDLVGKPLSFLCKSKGARVSVLNNYATGHSLDCQMLVAGSGVPRLIKGEDLVTGCHVLDFGYAKLQDKVVGDFDLESKINHLGFVSPSPGGMGPLVVHFLIMNFLGI